MPYEARYAGFDFFNAVTSPAAAMPTGGLTRDPNAYEIQAAHSARALAIRRNRDVTYRTNLDSDYDPSSTASYN